MQGNFTARRIIKEVSISETDVSLCIVHRFIYRKGHLYLQACKKGLRTVNDRKNCVDKKNGWQKHGPEYVTDQV